MIFLFTDFGLSGPYMGELKAVLTAAAPGVPVINLFADAPRFNPVAAGHLLAAYSIRFPKDSIFLSVVDPGVGSGQREAVIVEADDRWFVGPDNGLFDVVAARSARARSWVIPAPEALVSNTFHGRDVFAPAAARLAMGQGPDGFARPFQKKARNNGWRIVYIDGYGNAMTGIDASSVSPTAVVRIGGLPFSPGTTFADVAPGRRLWYRNSVDLLEVAVNQGNAAITCGLTIGNPVTLED